MTIPRISLGVYPTKVEEIPPLSRPGCALWVKRDDATAELYGGNKVRKLEYILADARARGARRLVTLGAVGSHHVLATTLFGVCEGFEVEAGLVPQPRTPHVADVLRAGLAHGLRPLPAGGYVSVALRVAPRLARRDAYLVAVGGSSTLGSMGYVDAALELAAQVRAGAMPEPDLLVVALGSGGTAGGLAAGLELAGLRTRVLGVVVAQPSAFVAWRARRLARACLRAAGGRSRGRWLDARLAIDFGALGPGYGHVTERGARATALAASVGLGLDPTYTAKTFASALDRVRAWEGSAPSRVVLYWHTLSSAPEAPLLAGAAPEEALDPRLRRLMRGTPEASAGGDVSQPE